MVLLGVIAFARLLVIVNYTVVALAITAWSWFKSRINQYSTEGEHVYLELVELEHYLEQADNGDVIQQLQWDPDYYYRMAPYSVVLECPSIWADRAASLPLSKPDWYDDSIVLFSKESFMDFLSRFGDICYHIMDSFDDSGRVNG